MARLFVAVWPTDEVIDELRRLHRKDQTGVRFVRPENWHVTLRFLGADADEIDAIEALGAASFSPSTLHLGPGVDLLGAYSVVVPVSGADELIDETRRATLTIGDPPRKRPVAHLTLARLKRRAQLPRILGHRVDASWTAREVTLVRSILRPEGARYEVIERWPTER